MQDVIVTGMGVLSPAGITLEDFWNTLYRGEAVYDELEQLREKPEYRVKIGATIKTSEWERALSKESTKQYGKAACYCMSTVAQALEDAGLAKDLKGKRVSIIIGTTMGEIEVEEQITRLYCQKKEVASSLYQKYPPGRIAEAVAEWLETDGEAMVIPAACAAGNYAIDLGRKLLLWDLADIVIAGGVDVFSYVAFAGFQRLLSLAPDRCRPFDKDRKGIVLGEGCGIVILEKEGARYRQKKYGRILGSAAASNAYHMTAPHKYGAGEFAAMNNALVDAGLKPSEIAYISAHGTGTRLNDEIEAKAINQLFGLHCPFVSSIKSMLGHSLGAASVFELIASLLMIQKGIFLPNINYETRDEACDLNIVSNKPVHGVIQFALSNSFAFGGQTSCLVLGK